MSSSEILTPVGRLVQGSLYKPQTTDIENRPLIYKNGPKTGQPRVEFWFALAIAKNGEKHWNQTPWGQIIWKVGQAGFPNGQANSPTFSWKIKDGDSTIPNSNGTKPCDQEGFLGHWILSFRSSFAAKICNSDGSQLLLDPDIINTGDYVQVFGNVSDNESAQQPGIYLNHLIVSLAGYGTRISSGADPKSVGFGQHPLPAGASPIPVSQGFNPGAGIAMQSPITPYPQILDPQLPEMPSMVLPTRIMLPKAGNFTYEQFIATGQWTDELLIKHGMMQG